MILDTSYEQIETQIQTLELKCLEFIYYENW